MKTKKMLLLLPMREAEKRLTDVERDLDQLPLAYPFSQLVALTFRLWMMITSLDDGEEKTGADLIYDDEAFKHVLEKLVAEDVNLSEFEYDEFVKALATFEKGVGRLYAELAPYLKPFEKYINRNSESPINFQGWLASDLVVELETDESCQNPDTE